MSEQTKVIKGTTTDDNRRRITVLIDNTWVSFIEDKLDLSEGNSPILSLIDTASKKEVTK